MNLSAEHIANLRKHAAYLRGGNLPVAFDMTWFSEENSDGHRENFALPNGTCGSVGCVVGHATISISPANENEEWWEYSFRVFGIHHVKNSHEWQWLFGPEWSDTDNSPEGAADRIEWLLDKELPGDWEDQMFGDKPLCYREATA